MGAPANRITAVDWTLACVKERKVFGQPVASYQNIRYKLAEMQAEVQMARVFVDKCSHERMRAAFWWLLLPVGIPDHRVYVDVRVSCNKIRLSAPSFVHASRP